RLAAWDGGGWGEADRVAERLWSPGGNAPGGGTAEGGGRWRSGPGRGAAGPGWEWGGRVRRGGGARAMGAAHARAVGSGVAGRGRTDGGRVARVTVKAHPRAKRTGVAGRLGEAWKLDLAAPPVDGKANEEIVRWFAETAGVARARVRIVSGATGRMKVVEI